MGASAQEDELRCLWWSLYDPVVAEKCSYQEQDLRGISILLGITFSCFKRLKVQYNNVKHEYELTTNRLQSAINDLATIEDELKSKNEKPCERCQVLTNQLDAQKKKAHVNEERMKSIARILNLGNVQKPSSDGDHTKQSQFAYAYTVVSQMLHCNADEPASLETRTSAQEKAEADEAALQQKQVNSDVKKACHENNSYRTEGFKFKCFDDITLVPESVLPDKPKVKIIVPETMLDVEEDSMDDVHDVGRCEQSTPEKQAVEKCGKENCSPVIRSSSVRLPAKSGNVTVMGSSCQSTADEAPATSLASPSLLSGEEDKASCCEAAEKWPGLSEDCSRKQADVWVLKPSDEIATLARCRVGRPASRKLMQTKLSLARLPRKVDVSSTQEFAGGIQHASTLAVPRQPDENEMLQKVLKESLEHHVKKQDNEDIILESPNSSSVKSMQCSLRSSLARSKTGRQEAAKRSSDLDETFLPQVVQDATKRTRTCDSQSTEQLLAQLGMPVQATLSPGVQPLAGAVRPGRVPDKPQRDLGPGYVYQRDTVRGKRERSKLKGWACNDCRDLYEGLHLTEVEKKALINECSRHRDKFPMRSSSPSDW